MEPRSITQWQSRQSLGRCFWNSFWLYELVWDERCLHEFIILNGQAGNWARYPSIARRGDDGRGEEGREEERSTLKWKRQDMEVAKYAEWIKKRSKGQWAEWRKWEMTSWQDERVYKFTGCVHTNVKCVCVCVMEIYLLLHHTNNLKRNADILQGQIIHLCRGDAVVGVYGADS